MSIFGHFGLDLEHNKISPTVVKAACFQDRVTHPKRMWKKHVSWTPNNNAVVVLLHANMLCISVNQLRDKRD